jgi:hypothetical protein
MVHVGCPKVAQAIFSDDFCFGVRQNAYFSSFEGPTREFLVFWRAPTCISRVLGVRNEYFFRFGTELRISPVLRAEVHIPCVLGGSTANGNKHQQQDQQR